MFGKKKEAPAAPPRRKGAELMSQMGMGGLGDFEAQLYGDVDNDEDLEAELLALQGKPQPAKKSRPRGPVNANDFDKMIAESMKDLDDEDISDSEDPELLDELQELEGGDNDVDDSPTPQTSTHGSNSITSLLEDRLNNYREASEAAKAASDSSKQRRADRGLKTIQDLLKKAKQGKPVDESEIPPHMAVSSARKPPASVPDPTPIFKPTIEDVPAPAPAPAPRKAAPAPPSEPSTSGSSQSAQTGNLKMLSERRDQYKKAALAAKHKGDMDTARNLVKISKQFDNVIHALEAGQPVDLSQMPPPPSESGSRTHVQAVAGPSKPKTEQESVQRGNDAPPVVNVPAAPSEEEERSIFQAPEPPKTALEALHQRLDKYKNAEQQAKEEGNSSKSRRMGRIAKQYQEAIRDFKAGKPVDFEELPTPPGYAPIPTGPAPSAAPKAPAPSASNSGSNLQAPAGRGQQRSPQPAQRSPQPQRAPVAQEGPSPKAQTSASSQKVMKRTMSLRADQQTSFLKERMQEYKMAAINAKKNNDIAQAKQYLRMAKGFEPMIEASESGLPVDLTQVPPSLATEEDNPNFVMVSREDCELSGDREEVFAKIEQDLISQIRTCTANSSHFSKLGDVMSANKFQKMENGLQKDLEALKNALRHKDPVPKFHYENRTFSMVQCNTDLGDNDLEMTVVRGVQYNPPSGYSEKDLDTYVKYEFPFPTDDTQVGQTEHVKSSLNPEYQEPVKFNMNRKSRALVRVIERKTIKLEIFYRRGFLKSDKLLGTVNVKLLPLETQCTYHNSHDLTDGRKSVGGKLEVKLRIRDPFKNKQVEEVKEKWLVIDQFIKTLDTPKSIQGGNKKGSTSGGSTCMEVLKFEKQQLDKQISSLRDSLSNTQLAALTGKSKLIQQKIEVQSASLKSGGVDAWKDYVRVVEEDIIAYTNEGKQFAQHGDMQKAQLMLTKKKLAEKEVAAIRSKIPNI
ncbi:Coiled-coil and C2 domain-containing protein 1A [Mactra antiquata]